MTPSEESAPGVSASEFRLLDQHGRLRAKLGLDEEDCPGLWLYAANSEILVDEHNDTGLTVYDPTTGERCIQVKNEVDGPVVSLYDRSGEVRAVLSVDVNAKQTGGRPDFWLAHNATGRDHFRLALDTEGMPFIEINDDQPGKSMLVLSIDAEGTLSLRTRGRPDRVIWPLPADP